MAPITFPHTFHDNVGETASGVQVMDNFNTLKAAIEALEATLPIAAGQKPGTYTARGLNTEYEPSPTRATLVTVEVSFGGGAPRIPITFIVPAGKKWKIAETSSEVVTTYVDGVALNLMQPPSGTGAFHQAFSSYTTL